ncbi:DUF4178 domain-containing protein [Herbidospora sp. NBRC 101105]|uniref:DUF4178 domain-containing protein n=1 Tax=Herbidospora sp. NBRC 101105 TaxID=3032195 RepID=UPI0024A41FB9|nr:DUF4178 domain-containing protein [Herbidospora sp. NBRC 101105]GLX98955.1 hypothetical protein Hesp01_69050 [Herbidospora sp. NBRC 101105]
MTTAVVLGLCLAAVVVVLFAYLATARREGRGRARAAVEVDDDLFDEYDYFDPRTLQVGDTATVEGTRYKAIGALHLMRQGDEWTEHLLDDGSRRVHWLSVQERPEGLEVMLWTPVQALGMVPAKSMLIMEGVEFFPGDRGTVAYRAEGMTGLPERGLLDFADYRAHDGRLLSFQRVQGGQWVASYALPLTPGSIQVDRKP